MGLGVGNLPANTRGTRDAGLIPGLEDPLEEEVATHSSILAWKIPWTEESGRLQSMGHKESDTTKPFSALAGTQEPTEEDCLGR